MSILAIQQRLKFAGFDPGSLDGKWGKQTSAALDRALAAATSGRAPEDVADPNDEILLAELARDEGFVAYGYRDSLGVLTIGYGRMIDEARGGGISRDEALFLKRNDIAKVKASLDQRIPWWRELDPVRRRVLQNMTFNMGPGWVDKFANTVAHIRAGRWREAAMGMRGSLWARQVGARAERLARMMETGRVA